MLLLVSHDLFFGSKITGTAQALGLKMQVAGTCAGAVAAVQAGEFQAILLDLTLPQLQIETLVSALPTPRPEIVAFGPHVETALFEAARQAGCELVLPRSKFSATLPELLGKYVT